MTTPRRLLRARAEAAVASVVTVLPHEIPPLLSAAATFFFVSLLPSIHLMVSPILQPPESKIFVVVGAQILSAYFVVLPLRDEGAISLGLDTLPGLFAGSLLLTVLAAPVASLAFSLPSIPKPRVRATSLNSPWPFYLPGEY
jgi:ATP:ADP antiporter, AAA family